MKGTKYCPTKMQLIWGFTAVLIGISLLWFCGPASALETTLCGKPFSLMGYINQSVAYGVSGSQYDTKSGFQSFLTQVLLEANYEPRPDVKMFLSGKGNIDWAYPVFSSDRNGEWREKGFDKARDRLFVLDNWDDVLSEAHITWQPGKFYFRVGKQIVKWGEMDVWRIMDQINPLDSRRGVTDVEFENTVLPVWLLRAEYSPDIQSSWLQTLNFQFIFNPSFRFRGNENIVPGNDTAGIWAPMVDIPLGGPYPFDYAHLGSLMTQIEKPSDFSSDGFKYAGRITANILDSRITLNGFYGRDLDYVTRGRALPPYIETNRWDNRMVMHPAVEGYYPLMKFVGMTFTRDLEKLKAAWLGGISPVLRLESFYTFNSTFATTLNTFEKFDEFRAGAGVDWKVKVPWLNPDAGITVMPQMYLRRVMDYPGTYTLAGVRENNWQSSLILSTSYWHARITPQFVWVRDYTGKANMFLPKVTYQWSSKWKFALGGMFADGDKVGEGTEPIKHKDHVYFTVSHQFY